ncbi:glycoside hydrolase family 6 protein [Blastococcus sp. LR1]|uniref:glycoside hydrolase family 6 protein n=1 Tax=Blastococcus sp. LR1 TaxID=2877000 RepID=UPI001CCEFC4C|nr:glycoside hydrolase family 6 protein [Blastococcus sp. LR1]MCA0144325.1 glycoside hydrolase family 6 protein [Blastococcus sp. LR1]
MSRFLPRARAGAVALAAVGLVACGTSGDPQSGGPSSAPASAPTEEQGRLSGELWTNPDGHGPVAVREAEAQGRDDEAAALAPLGEQPTATWFTNPGDPYVEVERLSLAAAEAGEMPVLVAYYVPNRDCGSYSAGGAPGVDAYLSWVGSFAAALGDRPAVVVLEPDAVAQAIEGCAGVDPAERYEWLSEAVQILDRQPETRIYVDAGNSTWVTDLPALSDALRRSGLADADGFSLNVANFRATDESAEFGAALSEQLERDGLPGVHFVIDTSRNGAGPPPEDGSPDHWCNPPGRRLGEAPTTSAGLPRVDALLWIKQPGDSDGTCRGAPPAGQWWPQAALELAGD